MFKIREARPDDIEHILRILHQLSDCSETKVEEAKAYLKYDLEFPKMFYYAVAIDGNDKVVGIGKLLIEQKLSHGCKWSGHIEDVVVDEAYRGHGIGKLIIEDLVKLAKFEFCYKVILDCDPDKVGFYEKCGFYQNGVAMRMDLE